MHTINDIVTMETVGDKQQYAWRLEIARRLLKAFSW